ncbi:microsomal glutathione S-transferase 1-like [Amphiura filiformis]|uniref:microsomal glutathione S-transferase 1-like n=1 Tax=Amphiura filiformis TaxID=82378 RepID=UPI003B20F215
MAVTFSLDNEVFRVYLAYAGLVAFKMLILSPLISTTRVSKRIYENPEDSELNSPEPNKYVRKDPWIERMRRCHLNDLENIVPFLIVGLLYVLTGPSVDAATWHFRIFVVSRCIHTIAYLLPLPQPTRFLMMYVGWFTTASMAVQCLKIGQF